MFTPDIGSITEQHVRRPTTGIALISMEVTAVMGESDSVEWVSRTRLMFIYRNRIQIFTASSLGTNNNQVWMLIKVN